MGPGAEAIAGRKISSSIKSVSFNGTDCKETDLVEIRGRFGRHRGRDLPPPEEAL